VKIISIAILERNGSTDFVRLKTDLPDAFPKGLAGEGLSMNFDTQKGLAREFVAKHFPGIPVKVVEIKI